MQIPAKRSTTIIFLAVLLAFSVALGLFLLRPFFAPVVIATILAVACHPLYLRLKRVAKTRNRAALLTTLAVFFAITVPVIVLVVLAAGEAINAAHFVSQRTAEHGGYVAYLMGLSAKPLAWVNRHFDISQYDLQAQLTSRLEQLSVVLLGTGAAILGNLVTLVINVLLAMLIAFFFFREGEDMLEWLAALLPLTRAQSHQVFGAISDAIVANLYGMLAVGGAQGLLTGLAMKILGVPSAVLLGMAAAFCSLIPVVGPALVWAPAAGYLFFTGRTAAGVFLLAWCGVVVGSIDNVLRPWVVGGRVEAHPLLLLLAILGGAAAFGFLGLFLGPVLLSVITALLAILTEVANQEEVPA
jgi:predicted PurR-regulated permease PerM